METLVHQLRSSMVSVEAIDDYVAAWHQGNSAMSLHDYLGMTQTEYKAWLLNLTSLVTFVLPLPTA